VNSSFENGKLYIKDKAINFIKKTEPNPFADIEFSTDGSWRNALKKPEKVDLEQNLKENQEAVASRAEKLAMKNAETKLGLLDKVKNFFGFGKAKPEQTFGEILKSKYPEDAKRFFGEVAEHTRF